MIGMHLPMFLYIERFKERVLPIEWAPRSILMSEAFAFCALASNVNTDMVIESGVWNGRSSEVWAKYFNPDMPIKAIDSRIRAESRSRLAPYPNVELIEGKGQEVIPELLDLYPDKRIALFIDGPKGSDAFKLANKHLYDPNVVLVGLHDLHKLNRQGTTNHNRTTMEGWERTIFFTDEKWFVDCFSFLDEGESVLDEEQKLKWEPSKLIELDPDKPDRILGSYGPTAGFAI